MSSEVHIRRPGAGALIRLLISLVLLSPLSIAIARLVRPEPDPVPVAAPPLPMHASGVPKPLLGFAINAHHISDLPAYLAAVDGIAELGANTMIIVTPMFQKRADSSRVRTIRAYCPTDDQLGAMVRRAKVHGLYTILMPIVLIENPGEKDWRGLIRPDDWDDWWTSYEREFDRFTALAVAHDVDMLCVGSELNSTEEQIDRWIHHVDRIRATYDGRLTYSANWDRYHKVRLWPLVDAMSVSAYFELERNRPGAPEKDLVRAWAPIRRDLLAAAKEWDKPLLLSEIGYPSLPWANAHPWNYVADDDQEADFRAQARSWRAFFRAWTHTIADPHAPIVGFCGYRWDPYKAGEDDDTGYGVVGKPAHEVIRIGFGAIRRASAAAAANKDG